MVVTKSKRIVGKTHIKHSPNNEIQTLVERETCYLVKSGTPFISAVKRIMQILSKFDKSQIKHRRFQGGEYKKVKYITAKGMGKAIEKALSIGIKFEELEYKVEYLTGSVEVLDEYKEDSEEEEEGSIYEKRMVSYIEARIWLKKE